MVRMRTLAFTLLMSSILICTYGAGVGTHLKQNDDWFRSDEAKRIAANILSWQAPRGDWPKNSNTTVPFTGDRAKATGTFDNGATTDELRFLARMVDATKDTNYSAPFLRGLNHILQAQYPNGGWPQYSPPPKDKYHRHITFNDGSMLR